jgi:hypothetical protein
MEYNICPSPTNFLAVGTILIKHQFIYFQSNSCRFIQIEKPFCLSEPYNETIARSDIGMIGRNIKYSKISALIISVFIVTKVVFWIMVAEMECLFAQYVTWDKYLLGGLIY